MSSQAERSDPGSQRAAGSLRFARDDGPPSVTPRHAFLDIARGAALCAMFVYHLAWDLDYFGLSMVDPSASPGWKLLSHAIASSFLLIAGLSLALAHLRGKPAGAQLRRLAGLALAAAAVSAVTYAAAPQAFISFGILHCILAGSLVALPLIRAPASSIATLAAALIAAPTLWRSSAFDAPWLAWTGLNATAPATLDYRPLLPWAGVLLAGVAIGRFGAAARLARVTASATAAPGRALAFMGRHSLAIYLLHQPVFLALLFAIASLPGMPRVDEAGRFAAACENTCVAAGTGAGACAKSCACVAQQLKEAALWERALRDSLSENESARVRELAATCRGP